MVASGQLPPGTELPSVRELAMQHAINPMTVSKAYSLLEAEGVLERNRGKPMTVREADAHAVAAAEAAGADRAASRAARARGAPARARRERRRQSLAQCNGRKRMSVPYVVAHELGKSFDGKRVLDDVSFAVAPGDVVGVLGKNGAGKTTLLELDARIHARYARAACSCSATRATACPAIGESARRLRAAAGRARRSAHRGRSDRRDRLVLSALGRCAHRAALPRVGRRPRAARSRACPSASGRSSRSCSRSATGPTC